LLASHDVHVVAINLHVKQLFVSQDKQLAPLIYLPAGHDMQVAAAEHTSHPVPTPVHAVQVVTTHPALPYPAGHAVHVDGPVNV
jgi:hypothetical protein